VDVSKTYSLKDGWKDLIQRNRLVQERYVAAVAKYYGITSLEKKTADLIERCIENQLIKPKLKISLKRKEVANG